MHVATLWFISLYQVVAVNSTQRRLWTSIKWIDAKSEAPRLPVRGSLRAVLEMIGYGRGGVRSPIKVI